MKGHPAGVVTSGEVVVFVADEVVAASVVVVVVVVTQGPWLAMVAPEHSARQSLWYVTPSTLHTASSTSGHTSMH